MTSIKCFACGGQMDGTRGVCRRCEAEFDRIKMAHCREEHAKKQPTSCCGCGAPVSDGHTVCNVCDEEIRIAVANYEAAEHAKDRDYHFCKTLDSLSELRFAAAFVAKNRLDDREFCRVIHEEAEAGIEHSAQVRRFVAVLRRSIATNICRKDSSQLAMALDALADEIWQTQGGDE